MKLGALAARALLLLSPLWLAAAAAAQDDAALAAALAAHAHEPTVDDIVRAALAASDGDPGRYDAMRRRARLRGVVPTLELGARRGQGIDLRSAADSGIDDVHLQTADDLMLAATLRFDFGRLLFAVEEVSITRQEQSTQARRREIVHEVVELYFRRKRLVLERELGKRDLDHELRIAEAEALLDAFTNGAFQRMMDARRRVK